MGKQKAAGELSRLRESRKWTWEAEIDRKRDDLMSRGLKFEDAELILGIPPKRGTMTWDYREMLRRRVGAHCISFGDIRGCGH